MNEEDRVRALLERGVPEPPTPDQWASGAQRRARRSRLAGIAIALVAISAGVGVISQINPAPQQLVASPAPTSVPSNSSPADDLVVGESQLIEQPNGDVTFCVGLVYQMLPPSCKGVTVKGEFSWDMVDHQEANGIRYTDKAYRLIGRLDPVSAEGTLTIVEPPEAAAPAPSDERDMAAICSDPTRNADPATGSAQNWNELTEVAATLPVVSLWTSDGGSLVNVLVRGDSDSAYKALRSVWGGPLCVGDSDKSTLSERETALERVAAALPGDQYLSGSADAGDFHDPALLVEVVRLDPELRSQIESAAGDVNVIVKAMFTDYTS